ncbi:unnamed protein product [Caenorhabditis nigoni]
MIQHGISICMPYSPAQLQRCLRPQQLYSICAFSYSCAADVQHLCSTTTLRIPYCARLRSIYEDYDTRPSTKSTKLLNCARQDSSKMY